LVAASTVGDTQLARQEVLLSVFALTGRSAGQSPAGLRGAPDCRRVALLPDITLNSASWRPRKGQEGLMAVTRDFSSFLISHAQGRTSLFVLSGRCAGHNGRSTTYLQTLRGEKWVRFEIGPHYLLLLRSSSRRRTP